MLNKFSASAKLYMLIFITAGSLVGLGIYGIADLKQMNQNTQTLYADRVLPFQQLANIRFAYSTEIMPTAQKVKNQTLTFKQALARVQKAQNTVNSNWHNYKLTYLTPEEALVVKQTDGLKSEADEAYQELITALRNEDTRALDDLIKRRFSADPAPFTVNITHLMQLQVKVGKQIFNNSNDIYSNTSKKSLLLIVVSLVVALTLSFLIIKNINKLIKDILVSNNTTKQSEEKYHSLFEQASDAIYVCNFKGYFTNVNQSMCQLVGYTREELLKMHIADLVNADLLKANPLLYASAHPGESVIGERKVLHKNGTIIEVEINGKKFENDRVIVIARDITARKALEAELKTAEVKFRTLAEKSMVGIYIVQNAEFIYVNKRFAEIFGYTPEELIGEYPSEKIIHPEYQDLVKEKVRLRKAEIVESVHYEAKGLKKDGSSNWVEFYGSRTFFEDEPTFIGSMIDITERKVAEEGLKSSEQKYKLLFESNPMPLWIVAKKDMTVITANDAASKLYGYTQADLLNMDIKKLRPAANWDDLVRSYEKDIADATDFGIIDHLKKDGTPLLVNIVAQDIIFEGERVRLTSTNDVTEKLKAEEQLKKTEANLQTILNTNDTAYALLDRDLEVLEYNNKALIFAQNEFNFDPESGSKLFDHLSESRRLQFFEHINDVFNGKTISYEVNYSQADGTYLWYYVRMFPISNKENDILGLVLAITDITERKNAEQSLQAAYDQIKANIVFIREMVWKQSHILRSPLANLKGLVTILQNDPGDPDVLSYIEIELERMDNVFIEMAADSSKDEMINFPS